MSLKKYNNIVNDVESILKTPRLTRSQNKILQILSLLKEIVDGFLYEESNTTNMPELESEESAAERKNQPGKGLKILVLKSPILKTKCLVDYQLL